MLPDVKPSESFAAFFADCEQRLRAALTSRFGVEVGREACAEALAYGWEHWDRVQGLENPVGYLYRVGVTKGRLDRRPFPVRSDAVYDSAGWFEPGLGEALGSLSVRQRTVVGLIHGYGWSFGEVARLLGLGKSTVQSYERRGMARLRRKLGVGDVD